MIYGNIYNLTDYPMLQAHPIWNEAFEAIQALPRSPEIGITELRGKDMFINIMKYDTVKPEDSRFETHRKYVDLQYTLDGAERIEWKRASDLIADGEYDGKKDLQFYRAESPEASVDMLPGYFSIYFPSDAHRPKVQIAKDSNVFKLVVKINLNLLNNE